ncbi:V-set domain-containing T-cell activation inhibitor 1-like [Centropristis striata]|uniref:V-set domain-containing T-cell activation inhibitor 1-like n=1 Tax=Centropristis striata TaxID=184440 RepID=UPI0027E1D3A4|nr:V-set domain-containing T-cell activation inhibitor 1-like [Centropristis striata]
MTGLISSGSIVLWLFLAYRWDTVTCQSRVQVYIGDDVLLPCQYSIPPSETVSVFWRDKDDSVVLDIRQSVADLSTQNQKFRGRVFSDQSLYKKGNFSIEVKNVQRSDGGQYDCNIPSKSFKHSVSLTVSGERVATVGPTVGNTAVTLKCLHTLLLLLSLICYCF